METGRARRRGRNKRLFDWLHRELPPKKYGFRACQLEKVYD
jgi:hypothetical protein